MANSHVSEYQHETFRPREAEALQMLQRIAYLVKPIMKRHSWKIGILGEFWPSNRNLMGRNWDYGQTIRLRLRHPLAEEKFLSIEEVIDVMLHELTHIAHRNHEAPFYCLWNELRCEFYQLVLNGYTADVTLSTVGDNLRQQRIQSCARNPSQKLCDISINSNFKTWLRKTLGFERGKYESV